MCPPFMRPQRVDNFLPLPAHEGRLPIACLVVLPPFSASIRRKSDLNRRRPRQPRCVQISERRSRTLSKKRCVQVRSATVKWTSWLARAAREQRVFVSPRHLRLLPDAPITSSSLSCPLTTFVGNVREEHRGCTDPAARWRGVEAFAGSCPHEF
jgi:hypothetical protein